MSSNKIETLVALLSPQSISYELAPDDFESYPEKKLSSPGPKPLVSKPKPKGLGMTLKSYGPPPQHPKTFRGSGWDYMPCRSYC